ncbi:MAG: hypothetical protein WCI52_02525 [bacterium]
MFKDFLIRKMLKQQLKGVPESEQEKMISLIMNNPELFKQIAEEVQAKVKSGQDQMSAVMEVMKLHKEELEKIAK